MKPTDFERFLDEVAATGDEADDDTPGCTCPVCLTARMEMLQDTVDQVLNTLDLIFRKLDSK